MSRPRIDLTGRKYGQMEVVAFAGTDRIGRSLWRCFCKRCRNESIWVYSILVKSPGRKDCGCSKTERNRDLTGETLGALKVLKRLGKTSDIYKRQTMYLCRCEICGREKEFPAGSILRENKSCGCRQYTAEPRAQSIKSATETAHVNGVNIALLRKKQANKGSATGIRGVYRDEQRPGQYRVVVQVGGKQVSRRGFLTVSAAEQARDAMKAELLREKGFDPDDL